ncbi:hypothetical protein AXE88_13195 [Staphylococcus aureus]|nr:hypothetical protein [Staphylococcus aureus]
MLYWRIPNIEAGEKSAYKNVQVGRPPTQRTSKRNSTGNASWRGPNIEKLEHQFQQAMKVGKDRNKFCENIISVPIP